MLEICQCDGFLLWQENGERGGGVAGGGGGAAIGGGERWGE